MIVVKFILGLIIIIGSIALGLLSIGVLAWLCYFIGRKTKGTIIEKILNFIGKMVNYIFLILMFGLLVIIIIGVAYNIGCGIIK